MRGAQDSRAPAAAGPFAASRIERCPLCGAPNACAAASSGHYVRTCWCEGVEIDAAVLDRIAAPWRGVACVCARCCGAPTPTAPTP